MKRAMRLILLGASLAACGGSSGGGGGGGPQTVTISGSGTASSPFMFSPTVVSSIPGGSVVVENNTGTDHTFTSEAAQGMFTPGSAGAPAVSFDTGLFTGKTSVSIPANAAIGTKIWFYCNVHKAMMNEGYVQIVAPSGGGGY